MSAQVALLALPISLLRRLVPQRQYSGSSEPVLRHWIRGARADLEKQRSPLLIGARGERQYSLRIPTASHQHGERPFVAIVRPTHYTDAIVFPSGFRPCLHESINPQRPQCSQALLIPKTGYSILSRRRPAGSSR